MIMKEIPVHCAHDTLIPLEKLVPNPRNPNKHPQGQIQLLSKIIEAQGWRAAITVSKRSGFIVRGHGRLEAARTLGCEVAPVDFQDYASEAEEWADLIADNRIAELAETDDDLLKTLLQEINSFDLDTTLSGYSDEELLSLLAGMETTEALTDEDDAPEPPEAPVSSKGDLWLLEQHRLLCGDSTKKENLDLLMGEEKAAMIFTDPPYNVSYGSSKKNKSSKAILNDNLGDGFERFLYEACRWMISFCEGSVYICMSSSEIHTLQKVFQAAGGHWSTFLIWAKDHFTLGRSDYQRQYEPILYGWKEGGAHFWCGARDQGDVWFFDKPRVNDLHPTMKPVALVKKALNNSSKPGYVILDPFAGSGSTLIACEKANRKGRLIELDPKYCDVIVRRWQAFSGKAAFHQGDNRTFDEVARERVGDAAQSNSSI
jgi:DNA modification methylase